MKTLDLDIRLVGRNAFRSVGDALAIAAQGKNPSATDSQNPQDLHATLYVFSSFPALLVVAQQQDRFSDAFYGKWQQPTGDGVDGRRLSLTVGEGYGDFGDQVWRLTIREDQTKHLPAHLAQPVSYASSSPLLQQGTTIDCMVFLNGKARKKNTGAAILPSARMSYGAASSAPSAPGPSPSRSPFTHSVIE